MNISKHVGLQSQANYEDNKNSKKNLHILEDTTTSVQVVDVKQVIVQILFKVQ